VAGGIEAGAASFSRGARYTLESNPIYLGEIRHRRICHPGQHAPIVDRVTWDQTATLMREHRSRFSVRASGGATSPAAATGLFLYDVTSSYLPKRAATLWICAAKVFVSWVLPGNTSIANGWPAASHNKHRRRFAACPEQFTQKLTDAVVLCLQDLHKGPAQRDRALRNHDPVLGQQAAHLVRQRRALSD
jgi:hypothetical protein